MAGSLKSMLYSDDSNIQYGVRIDESNGEALGFADVSDTTPQPVVGLPQNIKMRYVNVRHPNNQHVRRKFKVGSRATFFNLIDGTSSITTTDPLDTTTTVTWEIQSYRGEQRSNYFPLDTAQNDGDTT